MIGCPFESESYIFSNGTKAYVRTMIPPGTAAYEFWMSLALVMTGSLNYKYISAKKNVRIFRQYSTGFSITGTTNSRFAQKGAFQDAALLHLWMI